MSGSAILNQTVKFLRVWDNLHEVQEWQARDSAVRASDKAWNAATLPKAFECLQPMREAYERLDEERRGVLLAQMIRYVVTGE